MAQNAPATGGFPNSRIDARVVAETKKAGNTPAAKIDVKYFNKMTCVNEERRGENCTRTPGKLWQRAATRSGSFVSASDRRSARSLGYLPFTRQRSSIRGTRMEGHSDYTGSQASGPNGRADYSAVPGVRPNGNHYSRIWTSRNSTRPLWL
jgi:hypothetical protein